MLSRNRFISPCSCFFGTFLSNYVILFIIMWEFGNVPCSQNATTCFWDSSLDSLPDFFLLGAAEASFSWKKMASGLGSAFPLNLWLLRPKLGSPTRLGRNILQAGASGYKLGFSFSLLQNNSINSEYSLINFSVYGSPPTNDHSACPKQDKWWVFHIGDGECVAPRRKQETQANMDHFRCSCKVPSKSQLPHLWVLIAIPGHGRCGHQRRLFCKYLCCPSVPS